MSVFHSLETPNHPIQRTAACPYA